MIKTLLLSSGPPSLRFRCGLPQPPQGGVELGVLDCAISGGTGFIFGSKKDLHCTFNPAGPTFAPENYFGAVSKWGIDIGTTDKAVMRWLVFAPSSNIYAPGALAGDYLGASAEVTAAVGAGANLLAGGLERLVHPAAAQPANADRPQPRRRGHQVSAAQHR